MKKFKKLNIGSVKINLKKQTITPLSDKADEAFIKALKGELLGKDVRYTYEKGVTTLYADGVWIMRADKKEGMTHLNLPTTKVLENGFLSTDSELKCLFASELQYIGKYVLSLNDCIEHQHLPKVRFIDNGFLMNNHQLKTFLAPLVRYIGHYSLREAAVQRFVSPLLEYAGRDVLLRATKTDLVSTPTLFAAQRGFLAVNQRLTRFYAPNFYPERYGAVLSREDEAFLLHPDKEKLMNERGNLKRILKKETFFERSLLKAKNYFINTRF